MSLVNAIKELRETTNLSMSVCKRVIEQTNGDINAAIEILKSEGNNLNIKRQDKEATEGLISTYIHNGNQIGVMLEVSCESPAAVKSDELKDLANKICMHIAWANPDYLSRDMIPVDDIEKETAIHTEVAKNMAKNEAALPKIIAGRMEKIYYSQVCLLDQVSIHDSKTKIQELVNQVSNKLNEKVEIKRFIRWSVK